MKKFILATFISAIFFSCEQNEITEVAKPITESERNNSLMLLNLVETQTTQSLQTINPALSMQNGVLSFSTIDAYEDFISNGGTNKDVLTQTLLQTDNFNSLYEFSLDTLNSYELSEEEIEFSSNNPFFTSMLNQDRMIKIGDWFVKLDFNKKAGFIMSSYFPQYYGAFVEGDIMAGGGKIHTLSFEDDGIEFLKQGNLQLGTLPPRGSENSTQWLFCRENGAGERKSDGFTYINNSLRLDNKVVYQKAVVYFSLQGKSKLQKKSSLGIWVAEKGNLRMEYYYKFKPKCKGESWWRGNKSVYDNEVNFRPYESAKALNKYYYSAWFVYDNRIQTPLYYINHGY
ncbi:MAG: hypothetical protein OHK0038_11240 [Flammeovirgaceae bacterium]